MKITNIILAFTGITLVSVNGYANGHGRGHGNLENCLKAVSKIKSGTFTRAEFHNYSHEGKPSYEIEVKGKDGKEWEFECDIKGHIVEIEQEVESASDPLFSKKAKVKESEAKTTATALYPGEVEKVEYEIEFDGSPSYEFNIESDDGTEFNVEVSAITGEIIEVSTEAWEIGSEE